MALTLVGYIPVNKETKEILLTNSHRMNKIYHSKAAAISYVKKSYKNRMFGKEDIISDDLIDAFPCYMEDFS